MVRKTYSTKEIKIQKERYKVAQYRYMKGIEEPSNAVTKKRNEGLFIKAADEFEKLQKMIVNKKKAK